MRTLLLSILLLSCSALRATTLTVSFSPLEETGMPGDIVTFSGTLSNNATTTDFINSATVNLTGFDPADYDASDFLFDAPVSLAGMQSTVPFAFLTVTIPLSFTPNTYAGTFQVLGGTSSTASDVLGTGYFAVQVTAPAAAPEPATLLLLAPGLVLLAARYARCSAYRKATGARCVASASNLEPSRTEPERERGDRLATPPDATMVKRARNEEVLHRNLRLPDERARLRKGHRHAAQPGLPAGRDAGASRARPL